MALLPALGWVQLMINAVKPREGRRLRECPENVQVSEAQPPNYIQISISWIASQFPFAKNGLSWVYVTSTQSPK